MNDVIESAEKKKIRLIPKEEKLLFIRIEEIEGRKIYHTKIMEDLYKFGIYKSIKSMFFISFRGLFNQDKIEYFHLFPIQEGDKFLGIFYRYRRPIKNIVMKYEENGVMKTSTFSKVYYLEFRFKKGSVCCYLKGISRLLRKEKFDTKYYQSLIHIIKKLEREVYEFYGKKLPEGGLIEKWIQKNQK
ncbi:hypothetical protein A7978_05905 (plasmid) [Borrelia turicatae]|uniref:Uncharacterized protein n=1 Tax=Borrelia turicatae TaxID=142 RepID=A0A172XCZ4_BORTU|nr:DUF226 domain-containing protein [Borrelia turicatae]ANF34511.1 hypothetical protein A7978_05905 [Borrelia turicatae]UPA15615.1 DUF226 domain-containing protein [Borrelia turicatae]